MCKCGSQKVAHRVVWRDAPSATAARRDSDGRRSLCAPTCADLGATFQFGRATLGPTFGCVCLCGCFGSGDASSASSVRHLLRWAGASVERRINIRCIDSFACSEPKLEPQPPPLERRRPAVARSARAIVVSGSLWLFHISAGCWPSGRPAEVGKHVKRAALTGRRRRLSVGPNWLRNPKVAAARSCRCLKHRRTVSAIFAGAMAARAARAAVAMRPVKRRHSSNRHGDTRRPADYNQPVSPTTTITNIARKSSPPRVAPPNKSAQRRTWSAQI